MLDETPIKEALSDIGYRRLKRFVYKATWSTHAVEHFLYFSLYGKPKEYLTADFGLRNEQAQAFGFKSVRAYGGELYQLARHDVRTHCAMIFSLGRLALWKPRSSLYLPSLSEIGLAEKIKVDVQNKLFPIIRSITEARSLLAFLNTDVEPNLWIYSNGAIRAAMIVSLARKCGMDAEQIRILLEPQIKRVAAQLGGTFSPTAYLEKIIEDSFCASNGSAEEVTHRSRNRMT
jgi:hypothetical protein